MDIVHVDPGYGKVLQLLKSGGETMFVESDTYNPTSGVAFSRAANDYSCKVGIPDFDFTFEPVAGQYIKKVWSVKFSVYVTSSHGYYAGFTDSTNSTSSYPDLGIYNMDGDHYQFTHWEGNVSKTYYCAPNGAGRKVNFYAGFHNVSITYSLTADGTGSEITYIRATTICVDEFTPEVQIYSTTSAIAPPKLFIFYFPRTVSSLEDSEKPLISNVLAGQVSYEGDGTGTIPSDDGIPANTPVYRLPLVAPTTNNGFELNEDGIYVANTNGSTLLKTVDADTLINKFGDRPINHIVSYGNPGYRVGTAVTSATGISKSGDTIETHGTHALSFEKDMHVYDVWEIAEGNKFSTINDLQVGWRAGE